MNELPETLEDYITRALSLRKGKVANHFRTESRRWGIVRCVFGDWNCCAANLRFHKPIWMRPARSRLPMATWRWVDARWGQA